MKILISDYHKRKLHLLLDRMIGENRYDASSILRARAPFETRLFGLGLLLQITVDLRGQAFQTQPG